MTQPNFKDEIGNKYGKLTVISREQNTVYGTAKWLCKCECGNTKECRGQDLRSGRITHCGCENKPKRITNYFKIKNMSVDEMAEKIGEITTCGFCPAEDLCENAVINKKDYSCVHLIKQWLLQEVEE